MSLFFAGRYSGIARLIEGVSNGDPVSIGAVAVIGGCIVIYFIVKARSGNGDE